MLKKLKTHLKDLVFEKMDREKSETGSSSSDSSDDEPAEKQVKIEKKKIVYDQKQKCFKYVPGI